MGRSLRAGVVPLAASLVIGGSGCGGGPLCGSEPLTTEQRQCVFNTVWSAAAKSYPFFALKGIDWDAGYQQYEPLAMAAPDDDSFDLVVAQLVATLQDGHSNLSCPANSWGEVVPSLTVLALDGGYFVASVEAGSDAASQGVSPGDEILAVDGEAAGDRFARAAPIIDGSRAAYVQRFFTLYYLTAGTANPAQVELLQAASGSDRTVALTRGSAPPYYESYATPHLLPGGFGYLQLPEFDELEEADSYDQSVTQFLSGPGLILDLRGSAGGSTNFAFPLADRFFDQPTGPVFSFHKDTTTTVGFGPRGQVYTGPVAMLIDEGAFSTSNDFVQTFWFTHRATLVGRTTGGGAGIPEINLQLTPLVSLRLTSSWEDTVDGTLTEVSGVAPDVPVAVTPADLQAGLMSGLGEPATDMDLAAAVRLLQDAGT